MYRVMLYGYVASLLGCRNELLSHVPTCVYSPLKANLSLNTLKLR
ncbi:hypothetical protein SRABI96_04758 [Peribacillus sp. Bi96]|nr:hypothetical protein SRABI96_04758 [Peribacillus sp. Bi96]